MKKILLTIFSVLLVFSLIGCSKKSSTKEEKVLKLGVVPSSNSEKLVDDLTPFAKALGDKLGMKVEVFTASSYIGVIEGIGSGSVDFGLVPPFSAVLSNKQSNTKNLLVGRSTRGKPGYFAEVFVRKNSNIKNLSDLKGKKIAFVDPSSASGYIYAGAMLKEAGIDLDKDIQYQFSGGHDKSLQLLLNKDVDAVASYENVIRKYTKEFPTLKEDITPIAKSELIPGVTVVASNNLDDEMQKKIKQALLEIQNDKETIQILTNLFSITGFEEPNNDAYKAIVRISEKMNIDLNKVK